MKYCSQCGYELQDDAHFCANCGNSAAPDEVKLAEEKEFLDQTYRFLKYERVAWKITGVVLLVLCIVLIGLGLLMLAGTAGFAIDGSADEALGMGIATVYLVVYGIMFLPLPIIGLISAKKAEDYMIGMYADFRPAAQRCGSVGMIVFTAFFNEIALIFFLINFVRIKSNQKIIDRIVQRQQMPPQA